MNAVLRFAVAIAGVSVLSGCAVDGPLPLVFGQAHTVGVTISGSVPEQAAELSIGYRDKDIAVVPTHVMSEAPENNDALSTFGQFELDTEGGAEVKAGLGKFFATGMAARVLSEGFRCTVSKGMHESCTQH